LDEVIEEWKSAGQGGEKYAHSPSTPENEQERYERCLRNWEIMETRLHLRLNNQQEAFDAIDKELDDANR
jgi:hypothetical protein